MRIHSSNPHDPRRIPIGHVVLTAPITAGWFGNQDDADRRIGQTGDYLVWPYLYCARRSLAARFAHDPAHPHSFDRFEILESLIDAQGER